MNAISLTRLRHIVAVAKNASFSLAADEIGISQPALSRSIQAFEAEYGIRLFERDRGGVALTPAGKLTVQQARMILASSLELDKSLMRYNQGNAGRLSLGFAPLAGSVLLSGIATHMMRVAPHVQLVSHVRPAGELLEPLQEGEIEAIIANRWQLPQVLGIEHIPLGRLNLVVAVRAGHPAAGEDNVLMADLHPYPFASAVDLQPSTTSGHIGGFVCQNFHILRETVLETDCIWFTTPRFIARDVEEGRVVVLNVLDLSHDAADLWVAIRHAPSRSPALKIALEVARSFTDLPYAEEYT